MAGRRFPRPAVTVDVVYFATAPRLQVLLIRRKSPPCAGSWALPGGFVDELEDLEVAARRELFEETGVEVGRLPQVGTYGAAGRDPRGWTISVAHLAVCFDPVQTIAGDDAKEADWFSVARPPRLAFDHREIVRDARRRLEEAATLDQLPGLLPGSFTMAELQRAYTSALGRPVSTASLRRRLVENDLLVAGDARRPRRYSVRRRR